MILEDFKDIHRGESVIVICNGDGLKNIPFAFLESRPCFAINYFHYWTRWIKPTYWVSLDYQCYADNIPLLDGIPKFVPKWKEASMKMDNIFSDEVVLFSFHDDLPRTVNVKKGHPVGRGLRFGTTTSPAILLAQYMGASSVLLVGFDCTMGGLKWEGKGLSQQPHFYDHRDHPSQVASSWNREVGEVAKLANARGTRVVNLSIPTMCDTLPKADYKLVWKPTDETN